mgnify:CR=1 FL=1
MREGFTVIDKISIPSDFDAVGQVELLIDKVCNQLGVNEDYYGNVFLKKNQLVLLKFQIIIFESIQV